MWRCPRCGVSFRVDGSRRFDAESGWCPEKGCDVFFTHGNHGNSAVRMSITPDEHARLTAA